MTDIGFTDEERAGLEALAKERGSSVEQVVRDAVIDLLALSKCEDCGERYTHECKCPDCGGAGIT